MQIVLLIYENWLCLRPIIYSVSKMNFIAKYNSSCVALPMGCNDAMMFGMSMIMR